MPNPKNEIAKQAGYEDLLNEDTIDVEIVAIDLTTGEDLMAACYDNLQMGVRKPTPNDRRNDRIENDDQVDRYLTFKPLYLEAKKKTAGGKGYVTGLAMHYGLQNDKFCILYEPVGLVRNADITSKKAEYLINGSDLYFTYDTANKKFVPAVNKNAIDGYKKNIQIKRDGIKLAPFQEGVDTHTAVFSFQEIFTVLHDNTTPYEVSVLNIVKPFTEDGKTVVRHALMLAPKVTGPEMRDLKGVFADLAHLCPPHCTPIMDLE